MRLLCAILIGLSAGCPALGQAGGMAEPAKPAAPRTTELNTGPLGRMIAAAQPGTTVLVPAGVYREHIVINKPLTLQAQPGAIIDGDGSGDIVEITAAQVTLRGFAIRNTGIDLDNENAGIRVLAGHAVIENNTLEDILFGIDLREAPDCVIRHNRVGGKKLDIARRGDGIRLWRADRALIEANTVHDGRDAVLWYSQGITVRNNQVSDCRYGLHLMYSDAVVLEGNELRGNSVGLYVMYSKDVTITRNQIVHNRGPSGYGVGLKETDRFTVDHNLLIGNRVGVYLDGSPFGTSKPGMFHRNTLAYNDIGITFLPSVRGNELTENNFIDNFEQVSVAGRGELRGNAFSKGEIGNYWSDYVGYDQNGDGVGDFVHESCTVFENLMDREPKLRVLLFSPMQQAIEMVGRALPAVRPEPKFTDEVPRMVPMPIGLVPEQTGSGVGMLAAAGGVLGVGGLVVSAAGASGGSGRKGKTGGAA